MHINMARAIGKNIKRERKKERGSVPYEFFKFP